MESENLKQILLKQIKENPQNYPFIADFWDVEFTKFKDEIELMVEFGHFMTKNTNSIPFYKPISKIIDISKI